MNRATTEIILGIAVIVIFVIGTLFLIPSGGEDGEGWGGADGGAADLIDSTGYVPWFNPIWEPPSGEVESLFFCVQTAIGAVIVGYFFGYWRGAKGRKEE